MKALQAVRYVWQSDPRWLLATAGVFVVQGILPVLALYLTQLAVNAVSAGLTATDREPAFRQFALLVALSGLLAVAMTLCSSVARYMSDRLSMTVGDHIQKLLQTKASEVDLDFYENPEYYDTLHRAQREGPARPTRIVHSLLQVGQNGTALVGIVVVLLSFHWAVGAILLAAGVPGFLIRVRFAREMYSWQRRRTPTDRKSLYLDYLLTRKEYAKEIRLFGLGPVLLRWCDELRAHLRNERLRLNTRRYVAELPTEVIAASAVFGVSVWVGYRTLYGSLTLGHLVMYYQAVQRAQALLGQMLSNLAELYESNLFFANFNEFLALTPRITDPPHPKAVNRPLRSGIVLDRVSFQYPHGTKQVLDEISLTIRHGEHVALVGENGAGKTTLVKLLCRLYDPTSGAVYLDGTDLRELGIEALRKEISAVFQDYGRYHFTALENIWLGNVYAEPDRGRVQAAACRAGADELIARLKEGYDTQLGGRFGRGQELSVGEWQKVALARAFLRDAQIIILDEPTSAMDAEAEYELFQRFHELTKDRTAILISHRLSTVRMANQIYVMRDGRIVESGTHKELVDRRGAYARLFEMQAEAYR
jgi:ATP-binding cassette subfamily B protein